MRILLLFISLQLLSACSFIATSSSELTGIALLHDRRSSGVIINDGIIEIKAFSQLNSQSEIRKSCHFNVISYGGMVLVTGEASTEILRKQIIKIVESINDVKQVYDELVIAEPKSYFSRILDAYITTKVKYALSKIDNLPGFDATRVKIVTENKVVYLLGIMHKGESRIVTEIARKIDGVQQVVKIFDYINYSD